MACRIRCGMPCDVTVSSTVTEVMAHSFYLRIDGIEPMQLDLAAALERSPGIWFSAPVTSCNFHVCQIDLSTFPSYRCAHMKWSGCWFLHVFEVSAWFLPDGRQPSTSATAAKTGQ